MIDELEIVNAFGILFLVLILFFFIGAPNGMVVQQLKGAHVLPENQCCPWRDEHMIDGTVFFETGAGYEGEAVTHIPLVFTDE